ncbi:hypothetical protein F4820DRAFT_88612 [Hypoxylon rubiginosum]|uniref:Uncharacterized protein n=1 Tax=Hypoxylon rubiginosum TaxID=110542 RepID=A0ACB9ZAP3_9PEZI|nr:hypothetical protein F4820DRAFT_88612 [Hypoxylon rubiginosum]
METTANPNKRGETIIPTPKWFIALRVFQIVLALVVVAMTGWWIHGLYYDELGFVIVCGLFTWVIAVYAILAEKVASCRRAYNTWAILALDLLMIIFWLAAMGATANRRSKFTVPVSASCSSDGSAVNSGHCTVWKRAGVATTGALGVLSGIAGISALVMLLFVATFAYVCHFFRLSLFGHSTTDPEKTSIPTAAVPGAHHGGATELQGGMAPQYSAAQQSQPFLNQQPGQQQWAQQQQTGYPQQHVGQEQTGYTQQHVGQEQFHQGPVPDPYTPQDTGYPPQQVGQHQQQYNPQGVPYSPQGTPAPGQPYQVPYQAPAQ